jgi:pyrimidine-nucleoside phosphorylase
VTAVEVIEVKRDGRSLTRDQIEWLIDGYTRGVVTDYQMAAMLMAIFIHGLSDDELTAWTEAMLNSGDVLDFGDLEARRVDKHSTGGVGDKVSIPLAPMVAACGVAVPMVSGRGLGHTGGTLDKLESIPGFTTALHPQRVSRILETHGLVLAGQSETLVPADQKIYALRDATGTVPSIPLISSSIMSKKLAEDLDGLVLDVKVGRGAFMKDESSARALAETIVRIGTRRGVKTAAYLTRMDQPLGQEVGNANEIVESLDVLAGGGPDDLVDVVYKLGAEMLVIGEAAADHATARDMLEKAVHSGEALEVFSQVVEAQGGDPRVVEDRSLLPASRHNEQLPAPKTGFVNRCDAHAIGVAAMRLGAGRERKEDEIDPGVGITVLAKEGDRVEEGEPLARLAWNDEARLGAAKEALDGAWTIGPLPASHGPLILGEVRA